MVAAFPVAVGRDIVDVGGIFGEAAPRVADVVEVVRAEHVAARVPSPGRSRWPSMCIAPRPISSTLPTSQREMMEAGRVRMGEGDHVMVAAVDAVQKGDAVAGMVGEAHAERRAYRSRSPSSTSRVKRRTCERRRGQVRGAAARPGAPRAFGPVAVKAKARFLVRRRLSRRP